MNAYDITTNTSLVEKFIESLEVKPVSAGLREIIRPLHFNGKISEHNFLLEVNQGSCLFGPEKTPVAAGSFIFIPQSQPFQLRMGDPDQADQNPESGFTTLEHRRRYMLEISGLEPGNDKSHIVTIANFSVILYKAFPFFPLLEMPPFVLAGNKHLDNLMKLLSLESEQNKAGKSKLIRNYMEELMVHLFRHIESIPELSANFEKLHYLTDVRLIDIVSYIEDNLDKDLSNKAIAQIAYVSEDYVGQFFKAMTNRNLQDYIENQRLERALQLLKTIPNSVQEIAAMVGFKDPAYFSRRFKLRFDMNANSVRQQKNQVI